MFTLSGTNITSKLYHNKLALERTSTTNRILHTYLILDLGSNVSNKRLRSTHVTGYQLNSNAPLSR